MARSPRRSRRRIYWDSCVWTALIWNETVTFKDGTTENRSALCRAVITDADKGNVDLFTSALALVEVNKHPDHDSQQGSDKLRDFFENDYIVVVALDRNAGELGRDLMQRRLPGLKPLDASHLVSAIIANADEMHTFDDALLKLDGKIQRKDGTDLKICKPSMGGSPLPLLDSPSREEIDEPGESQGSDDATIADVPYAPVAGSRGGTGYPGERNDAGPRGDADHEEGGDPQAPAAKE